jgi:hypothetical protein
MRCALVMHGRACHPYPRRPLARGVLGRARVRTSLAFGGVRAGGVSALYSQRPFAMRAIPSILLSLAGAWGPPGVNRARRFEGFCNSCRLRRDGAYIVDVDVDVCVLRVRGRALSSGAPACGILFLSRVQDRLRRCGDGTHIGGGSAPPIVRDGWIIFLRTHVMPETRVYEGGRRISRF